MQRNIDSFFKRVPATQKKSDEENSSPAPKKRKARVISSDEDEQIPPSPQVSSKAKESKKSRIEQESPETNLSKKPSLSKLKTAPKADLKKIDPSSLFGGETKRIEAKRPPKPKDQSIIELEDDDIDQSLMEIDLDESISAKKYNEPAENVKPKKQKVSPRENGNNGVTAPLKISSPKSIKLENSSEESEQIQSHATPKAAKTKSTKKNTTPRAKKEHTDLETSVLSDEDRHERKRMAAMLYQKYKNRSSCINPGSKEVPKGKPNCLQGLTFLVTGVLESIERDEAASIIKEYGGKTMTVVGKRLNYLIAGEDSGPKKLAQAEEFNIPILSEDGFFDLIRERSGEKVKKEVTNNASTSPKNKKIELKIKKEAADREEEPVPEKKTLNIPKVKEELKMSPKRELKVSPKKELNNNNNGIVKSEPALTKSPPDENMLAWVDKYKPTSIKEIIGQHGAASNVTKLMNWLSKWYISHDGTKKLQKPNPWAKNDDGSFYKAALLSGPPGIGKTTTATLVCKELGFDAVEFNASDTRSKRLLKEEVSELLSNKSLYGYFHGQAQAVSKKHVLIMDEVDGMAGNEDRGGVAELISLIKDSSVPIICMCNDRNHQKMRSLVNYCYDLRFNKPRVEQIKGRILSICCKEKIKIEPARIEEIIAATNNDIRQSINHISLLSAGKELDLKSDRVNSGEKTAQKDLKIGPWEVVRKVFSADEHKRMSLYDKCDLFFHDYSLGPLFVQQNYLQVSPAGSKSEVMSKVAATADALSIGDMVDKRIRSNSAWSLLPTQAIFSSVLPGENMSGTIMGQINFPGWLGKYSRANKRSRLAQEIHDHTRIRTSGSRLSIRLDYAPFLLEAIVRPLREEGMEGVEKSLNVMKEYHLLREDIESLIELCTWSGKKSPMDAVDGRVKAALTRAYNKEVMAYSYSAQAGVKKKRGDDAAAADEEMLSMEAEEGGTANAYESDEDEKDDLASDGLIKAKKKTAAATKASTSKAAAGTSKKATASKPKTTGGGSKSKK